MLLRDLCAFYRVDSVIRTGSVTLKKGLYRGMVSVGFAALIMSSVACATFGNKSGSKSVYYQVKVEKGDSLASIANQFDTDWRSIVKDNNLGPDRQLRVGQVIKVRPGPAGLAAADKSAAAGRNLFTDSDSVVEPAGSAPMISPPTAAWQEEDIKTPSRPVPAPKNSKSAPTVKPKQGLLFGGASDDSASIVTFRWPVASTSVSSRFGPRWGRFHNGIDIRANRGAAIFPSLDGKVIFAGKRRGYGNTMIIDHGHYKTLYGHCQKLLKKRGDWVAGGDLIAQVGASGNARGIHLHFEIQTAGNRPVDPEPLLEKPLLTSLDFFELGKSLTSEMLLALAE